MKKYFTSLLIPCLLPYLTGCYSMQEVGKHELYSKESPELYLKTKDREFKFDEYSYSITNDTLQGKGEYSYVDTDTDWSPFDGKVAVNDAEEIQISRFNKFASMLFSGTVSVLITGIFVAAEFLRSSPGFNR